MKTNLAIIFSILVFVNCSYLQEKTNHTQEIEAPVYIKPIENHLRTSILLGDTTTPSTAYIIFSTTDSSGIEFGSIGEEKSYQIEWGKGKIKKKENFNKIIKNRIFRMPPILYWVSEDYICLNTMWTGPFSDHLFLPLKEELDIQFFEEDIEYMDSIQQFVVYIQEDDEENKVIWTIQSLIQDKKESFEMPIPKQAISYPWYDSLTKEGDDILIKPEKNNDKFIRIKTKEYRQ